MRYKCLPAVRFSIDNVSVVADDEYCAGNEIGFNGLLYSRIQLRKFLLRRYLLVRET